MCVRERVCARERLILIITLEIVAHAPVGLRAFYILAVTRGQSIHSFYVLATLDTLLKAYNGSRQGSCHFAKSH